MDIKKIILTLFALAICSSIISQSLINSRPRSRKMSIPKTDLTSNWFIGVKVGHNHLILDQGSYNPIEHGYAPAFNVLIGKDLSAFFSTRIESTGFYLNGTDKEKNALKIDLIGVNWDVLANLNNLFQWRIRNFVMYAEVGVGYNYTTSKSEWFQKNNLLSHRVGTLFEYNTGQSLDLTAELVLNVVHDNFNRMTRGGGEYDYYGQYTIGFKYYFNREDF